VASVRAFLQTDTVFFGKENFGMNRSGHTESNVDPARRAAVHNTIALIGMLD
jgi:hypothetical protein